MAKGKKTGGRDWKPGQSGNPSGMSPLPPEVLAKRRMTRQAFEEIANRYLYMTPDEITAKMADPLTPAIEIMVASVIVKAGQGGDQWRLDFLLNRLLGKVPDKVQHSGEIETKPEIVFVAQWGMNAESAEEAATPAKDPEIV